MLNPAVLLENDKFMDTNTYQEISKFITRKLAEFSKKAFWQTGIVGQIKYKNIKPIIFALEADFGIVAKKFVYRLINKLTIEDKILLKKNKIIIGKKFVFYEHLSRAENIENRWLLSSLFFNSNLKRKSPEKHIFVNANNFDPKQLKLVGYVKIGEFAVKVEFLELFLSNIYNRNATILYYNNYHYLKYKINFQILNGILNYLGYIKIAGTTLISYWKKPKYMKELEKFNTNSPFYVLKKLQ